MPLRDHFRSPLADHRSWEGLYGGWPAVIVQKLGTKLPDRYYAEPRIILGTQLEIDFTNFDDDAPDGVVTKTDAENTGIEMASWSPPKPTLAIETEPPDRAVYEVRIFDMTCGRRLVAAVEIVSPANKDWPEHRRMFVAKCAALLEQQVTVAIVDLVTSRDFNLYGEVLELLGQTDSSLGTKPPPLYAVSCRWRPTGETRMLETWNHPLTVGQPLPTLPLWLTETFAVPLELEESYEQTCRDLRIP